MPIGNLQKNFVPSEYIFESTPLIGKKSSGLGVMVSIFFPKKYINDKNWSFGVSGEVRVKNNV